MSWTEGRIEELRTLAAQGLSARQIGNELGVSRNTVIGKMHRMHIPFAETKPKRKVKRQRPSAGRVVRSAQPHPALLINANQGRPHFSAKARIAQAICAPVELLKLKYWSCRWPIDGPNNTAEQRRFCGHERMHDLTPYCAKHHAVAYTGLPKKRRIENGC